MISKQKIILKLLPYFNIKHMRSLNCTKQRDKGHFEQQCSNGGNSCLHSCHKISTCSSIERARESRKTERRCSISLAHTPQYMYGREIEREKETNAHICTQTISNMVQRSCSMTFENNFQVEQRLRGLFKSNKNHFDHCAWTQPSANAPIIQNKFPIKCSIGKLFFHNTFSIDCWNIRNDFPNGNAPLQIPYKSSKIIDKKAGIKIKELNNCSINFQLW